MEEKIIKLGHKVWTSIEEELFSFKLSLHENESIKNEIIDVGELKFLEFELLNYPSRGLDNFFICSLYIFEKLNFEKLKNIIKKLLDNSTYEGLYALNYFFNAYLSISLKELITIINTENNQFKNRFLNNICKNNYSKPEMDNKVIENSGIDLTILEQIRRSLLVPPCRTL